MSISCFPIPEDPCAWSYSRQEWVPMPVDRHQYGWSVMRELWVKLPADGHQYGWSIVREVWVKLPADDYRYGWSIVEEVWVRQPNPMYRRINGTLFRWIFDQWDGSMWMASNPPDEDDSSNDDREPQDYQAEADDMEDAELEKEFGGLTRRNRELGI